VIQNVANIFNYHLNQQTIVDDKSNGKSVPWLQFEHKLQATQYLPYLYCCMTGSDTSISLAKIHLL
jgi:hypothetical protein